MPAKKKKTSKKPVAKTGKKAAKQGKPAKKKASSPLNSKPAAKAAELLSKEWFARL